MKASLRKPAQKTPTSITSSNINVRHRPKTLGLLPHATPRRSGLILSLANIFMKEDILEQLVDDYPKLDGYFTIHNVRFNPGWEHPDFVVKQDAVGSDIDVIGFHPRRSGVDRVKVVTCKSWQSGFSTQWWSQNVTTSNKTSGREARKF